MPLAGVLVFIRHGDRMGFYQSPTSYAASKTNLTTLGALEQYRNGQDLRAKYITSTGDLHIAGINTTKAQGFEMSVVADGAGEGSVIIDSAQAMFQGLYPPFNETEPLANGSVVVWPNRAQVQDMQTVEANEAFWFEGWTSCNAWTKRLNAWYNSSSFLGKQAEAQPFFNKIKPLMGGRKVDLASMWNVWDYINVNNIHNATFAQAFDADSTLLPQARYWASYHESNSFSDASKQDIGNIAGTAFLPLLISSLQDLANTSQGLKWVTLAGAYKPFLALGSLIENDNLRTNVVDYASSLVFEVNQNSTVNILLRNGSTDADWAPVNVFGGGNSLPLTQLVDKLQPYALTTRAQWCDACKTTDARGCDVLAKYNGTGGAGYAADTSTLGRHRVSPVVAGVIGAMVTLAVVGILAVLGFFVWKAFASPHRGHKAKSSIAPSEAYGPDEGASTAIPLRTPSQPGSFAPSDHLQASEHSHPHKGGSFEA